MKQQELVTKDLQKAVSAIQTDLSHNAKKHEALETKVNAGVLDFQTFLAQMIETQKANSAQMARMSEAQQSTSVVNN